MDEYMEILQYFNVEDTDIESDTESDIESDELDIPALINADEILNNNEDINNNDPDLLQCENCNFRTKDPICLLDHNMIVHEGAFNDQFYCDYCARDFMTMEQLDDHINLEHSDEDSEYENYNNNVQQENNQDNQDAQDNQDDQDEENSEENSEDEQETQNNPTNLGSMHATIATLTATLNSLSATNARLRLLRSPIIGGISQSLYSRYATKNGPYECPTCELRFNTPFYLGEHFTESHRSYEEQLSLNETTPETSFPSFRVLAEMGVIVVPYGNDNRYIKKYSNEKCLICCKHYSIYNVSHEGELINHCDDLDNLYEFDFEYSTSSLSQVIFHDDPIILSESIVHYKRCKNEYGEYMNKSKNIKQIRFPLTMACCKTDICHDCLKQYLQSRGLNGTIKCPYCMIDHTKYDIDYIRIVDIEKFNKQSWQQWWMKNDRIDMLT